MGTEHRPEVQNWCVFAGFVLVLQRETISPLDRFGEILPASGCLQCSTGANPNVSSRSVVVLDWRDVSHTVYATLAHQTAQYQR